LNRCSMCNEIISAKNTKSYDYTRRDYCGICYLKKKKQERKEKGLK